jgi:hypothetical protein
VLLHSKDGHRLVPATWKLLCPFTLAWSARASASQLWLRQSHFWSHGSITRPLMLPAGYTTMPAGYILGFSSYLMAGIVLNLEMDCFVPVNTWLVRMPLVATFAAQVAKLRGVVLIMGEPGSSYFFWLFVALVLLQGLLAAWAVLIGCPVKHNLQLLWQGLSSEYEVHLYPQMEHLQPCFIHACLQAQPDSPVNRALGCWLEAVG